MSFFSELRRRHVFKVGISYIVVGWLILQVVDVLLGNLDMPAWTFRLILVLLLIGFPVAIMLAWAYDLSPDGIKRTSASDDNSASNESERSAPDSRVSGPTPPKASVAVLPFVNMSGDKDNEYFSDGLAEELLNVLAKIDQLKVAARTSSFHFKGETGNVADIAKSLGVATVLEGSVRQSGSRIRITAQLISAADGYHLWSETYDRELDDIFAVQDEIALSVAAALKVKLLGQEGEQINANGTNNTAAFQAYLQGMHYKNQGSNKAAMQNAVSAFETAIQLDPLYAQAYAGLASSWDWLTTNSFIRYEEGIPNIEKSAARAIELGPNLADGYLVLGRMLLHYKLDQQGARKAINRAMKLNPGNSEVQVEFARISCYFGDVDASVSAANKALELDPVSKYAHYFLGHVLYFGRRYDEAIQVFQDLLRLDPDYPRPRYTMGMCMFMKGDAAAALKEVLNEPLSWMQQSGSAILLHKLGRHAEAEEFMRKLFVANDENYALYQLGQIHSQWGDADTALMYLNKAHSFEDPGLSQLLVDPLLDPLREDPRFEQILIELGFK